MGALYTIRVELHGAEGNKAAYDTLHGEMHKRGFKNYVRYPSGESYWLPPAEYVVEAPTKTKDTVRGNAGAAAAKTGFNYSLWVCEVYQTEYCSAALTKKTS